MGRRMPSKTHKKRHHKKAKEQKSRYDLTDDIHFEDEVPYGDIPHDDIPHDETDKAVEMGPFGDLFDFLMEHKFVIIGGFALIFIGVWRSHAIKRNFPFVVSMIRFIDGRDESYPNENDDYKH